MRFLLNPATSEEAGWGAFSRSHRGPRLRERARTGDHPSGDSQVVPVGRGRASLTYARDEIADLRRVEAALGNRAVPEPKHRVRHQVVGVWTDQHPTPETHLEG